MFLPDPQNHKPGSVLSVLAASIQWSGAITMEAYSYVSYLLRTVAMDVVRSGVEATEDVSVIC